MATRRSTRATVSRRTIPAGLLVAALSATQLFAAPHFLTAPFRRNLSAQVQNADSAYVRRLT